MGCSFKNKKGISIVKAFQIILKQSNRKPNKIWVDKGSEFYNAYFKKWLRDNDKVMYSTHNEGKSVVAERFIRTIKSKIYKYMTSISKNAYIDKLDDIADEYNIIFTFYIVYKLDPLASNRDKSYTIQNATDYDKNNYKGYGICFDERSEFGHTITIIHITLQLK